MIRNVTRWTGNAAGMPIAREAATNVKQTAAFRDGSAIVTAALTWDKAYTAITFTDWASFGRVQQALVADGNFQSVCARALKVVELQERSLLVTENL